MNQALLRKGESMTYVDKYEAYLNQIPGDAKKSMDVGKRIVMGYTSNYDIVLKWNIDVYNAILNKYLKEEPFAKNGDVIRSLEDFARITCYQIMRGLGGTFDISLPSVCDFLKISFETEGALGGTCAQGATALLTLGLPTNVHITDRSCEVCAIMGCAQGVTAIEGQEMVPIERACSKEPSECRHFILQFAKDDVLIFHGVEHKIPQSNRLILLSDEIQKYVPIDQTFLTYWENRAEDIYAYSISGFDAITDRAIMRERTQLLAQHLMAVKRANPKVITYFEGAFYLDLDVKDIVEEGLCPHIDILGMNEEELVERMVRLGRTIDIGNISDILESLQSVIHRYAPKGIILHSKDYSMYYGAKLPGIDIEKGLSMGNLMSATRARIGKYGTIEECKETLTYPLSSVGLALEEALCNATLPEGTYACMVPSRYLEHPKYTVGLGDTFVAGVTTCFIV